MAIDLNQTLLSKSLLLLGEFLDSEATEPVHLVVIGGSALLATGVVSRTTEDVDVWAQRGLVDLEILPAYPLPPFLAQAATKVAGELGLKPNWLNAMAGMVAIPLNRYPPRVWDELTVREYGNRLTISFAGRPALLHLKFHSAIDPKRERRKTDAADLAALAPSAEEAASVLNWLFREELVVAGAVTELRNLLKNLGHEGLVCRYPEFGA